MNAKRNLLVLAGAAVGGTLGYFLFFWVLGQGLYGLVIPGGLLGFGAAWVRGGSTGVAMICGLAGLALSLFCRWRAGVHESFGEMLRALPQTSPVILLMIALGAFIAFWLPFRSRRIASTDAPAQ